MNSTRWKIRRRIVNLTLAFCAVGIAYLIFYGNDTRLHETIANGLMVLAGSTIGSYIFGSTWDDKNIEGVKNGSYES